MARTRKSRFYVAAMTVLIAAGAIYWFRNALMSSDSTSPPTGPTAASVTPAPPPPSLPPADPVPPPPTIEPVPAEPVSFTVAATQPAPSSRPLASAEGDSAGFPAALAEASSIAPGIAEAACGSEFQAAALAYAWLVAADFGPSTLPACDESPTPPSGRFLSNVYYGAIPGRSDTGPVDVSPFRAPNGGYANEPGASILSLNATCAALFLRQLEGRPAAVRHPLTTTGLCFI